MKLNLETTKESKDEAKVEKNNVDMDKSTLIKMLADELYNATPSGACQNCES
jgi:hypothetical protein